MESLREPIGFRLWKRLTQIEASFAPIEQGYSAFPLVVVYTLVVHFPIAPNSVFGIDSTHFVPDHLPNRFFRKRYVQ